MNNKIFLEKNASHIVHKIIIKTIADLTIGLKSNPKNDLKMALHTTEEVIPRLIRLVGPDNYQIFYQSKQESGLVYILLINGILIPDENYSSDGGYTPRSIIDALDDPASRLRNTIAEHGLLRSQNR